MLSEAASLADFTPGMKGLLRNYIPGSGAGIKKSEHQFPPRMLTQTQFSDYTKLDGNYRKLVGFGS